MQKPTMRKFTKESTTYFVRELVGRWNIQKGCIQNPMKMCVKQRVPSRTFVDKHSAALFHNSNLDVRMVVHGDDFVCLSDDDGLNHIDTLLKSTKKKKDMGTLGFEDSDAKRLLLWNRVFRVGTDQT